MRAIITWHPNKRITTDRSKYGARSPKTKDSSGSEQMLLGLYRAAGMLILKKIEKSYLVDSFQIEVDGIKSSEEGVYSTLYLNFRINACDTSRVTIEKAIVRAFKSKISVLNETVTGKHYLSYELNGFTYIIKDF